MFKLLLQNFIKANGRSPNAIEMLQLKFKAASQANRGQVLPFKQKRDFAAEIKAMMDDGTIKVGQVDKKNDNVLQRELFKNSNLNNPEPVTIKSGVSNSQLNKNKAIDQGIKVEPVNEKFIQFTIQDIKKKEPIEGMKIANQIIKREGDFVDLTEEQSKKILTEVNDHIMGVDLPIGPEDLAKGGRAGFYTGGITDVEPSLDDIGHGSDSLMARTRLVSPGSQATTSTGLNYLLAEDNDNMRIPFSTGKLAGTYDYAEEENKALEERIARNKKMTDMLNKMYDERAIKNAPEGVLMDPPPRKNSILSLGEEGTPQDGGAYSLNSDAYSNTIIFDDGTVYYKDTGEYYNDEGQVPGPSKGAKIKPKEMEAAEGGRIGFSAGGDGRRAFLKLMATLGGGIAGLKSGILGLGEGTTKKAITETVKQSAGSGYPPPYFFKLVEKIKFMGDDITEKAATQEREIVKRYKDYEMTEDIGTGNIVIKKRNEGSFYDQDGIISDEYIVYKPGQADELTKGKKPPPEYDEYTVRPDGEGKLRDSEDGLDSIDEILEEVGDPDSMTLKKANGGRIGFSGGKLATLLAGKKITSSSGRFLEKIFGKGSLNEISKRDPEMHRGLLEVVEMFRNRDNAGLIEYMQNFLPHMSKKEIQAFIKGDAVDAAGQGKYGLGDMQGQLIRLGSGRDYKGKLEAMKKLDNAQKLDTLDVTEEMIRKPNASGGIQTMLGE